MRVREAYGDQECTREDGEEVNEVFLPPNIGLAVDEVGEHTAHGSEENIEKTEHGSPISGAGLAELREILNVVGTKDRVDGELGAEGAEVAAGRDHGLQGEDNGHGFLKGGLDDDFTSGSLEHGLLADLGFVVEGARGLARSIED